MHAKVSVLIQASTFVLAPLAARLRGAQFVARSAMAIRHEKATVARTIGFVYSSSRCRKYDQQTSELTPIEANTLIRQVISLPDSVNHAWNAA